MNDKKKITILYIIIIFLIVLISLVILKIVFKENNKSLEDSTQGTSQNITKTEKDNISTTTISSTLTNNKDDNLLSQTTSTKNTSSTTSTKKTTSSLKTTEKTTKATTTKVLQEYSERETTKDPTKYPNALDIQEWEIVELINNERQKNGLKPLGVSPFLRNLAEEAADYWYDYSDQEIKNYLYGYSNYRKKSNNLTLDNASKTLYNDVRNNTNITNNKYLNYLGVGVIYRDKGISGIPTFYFVIIYE